MAWAARVDSPEPLPALRLLFTARVPAWPAASAPCRPPWACAGATWSPHPARSPRRLLRRRDLLMCARTQGGDPGHPPLQRKAGVTFPTRGPIQGHPKAQPLRLLRQQPCRAPLGLSQQEPAKLWADTRAPLGSLSAASSREPPSSCGPGGLLAGQLPEKPSLFSKCTTASLSRSCSQPWSQDWPDAAAQLGKEAQRSYPGWTRQSWLYAGPRQPSDGGWGVEGIQGMGEDFPAVGWVGSPARFPGLRKSTALETEVKLKIWYRLRSRKRCPFSSPGLNHSIPNMGIAAHESRRRLFYVLTALRCCPCHCLSTCASWLCTFCTQSHHGVWRSHAWPSAQTPSVTPAPRSHNRQEPRLLLPGKPWPPPPSRTPEVNGAGWWSAHGLAPPSGFCLNGCSCLKSFFLPLTFNFEIIDS